MNTIHFYDVPAKHMILAARAAGSFGKKDVRDSLLCYGDDNRKNSYIASFWCWRTRAGNISVRWVK